MPLLALEGPRRHGWIRPGIPARARLGRGPGSSGVGIFSSPQTRPSRPSARWRVRGRKRAAGAFVAPLLLAPRPWTSRPRPPSLLSLRAAPSAGGGVFFLSSGHGVCRSSAQSRRPVQEPQGGRGSTSASLSHPPPISAICYLPRHADHVGLPARCCFSPFRPLPLFTPFTVPALLTVWA